MEQPLSPAAEEIVGPDETPDETTVAPPDPPTGAVARPATPILALSEDPVLLEAVAAAALDQATLIVSPSPDRFVDQVVATASELALIDAASAPGGLAQFLDSLHRQFPQLQLLIAAPGTVQHQISAQIADGTVFRFVHKPASAQRLKLFIDAALRARQTRITEQILKVTAEHRSLALPPAQTRQRWPQIAAGIALALVIGAVTLVRHSPVPTRVAADARAEALAAPKVAPPVDLAAQTEAEKEAIDRASAERSERAELERVAQESAQRKAALAEQARRVAGEANSQPLQSEAQAAERVEGSALELDPEAVQRAQANAAQLAQVALGDATGTPEAAAASSTSASMASSPIVEESSLHRVLFTPPVYPMDALVHKVTGIVELEFTVTAQGDVTDIKVTAADPVGVFEHAATAALSRSRYEPVEHQGVPVAQRAHIRLRFTL